MRINSLLILLFFLFLCSAPNLAQEMPTSTPTPTTTETEFDDANDFGMVQTTYTCEEADKIRFDKTEYLKLEIQNRVLVDGTWQSCQTPPEPNDDTPQVVMIINPTPSSDNDRLFYGLIKRKQLVDARNKCSQAGMAGGVALTVFGTAAGNPAASEIGAALFKYSDVSCSSFAKQIEAGNILAVLGPSSIVRHAVANKLTKDVVNLIPLLSSADKKNLTDLVQKVTAPPSITIGSKNVQIKGPGGAKITFRKPRFKKPKIRF